MCQKEETEWLNINIEKKEIESCNKKVSNVKHMRTQIRQILKARQTKESRMDVELAGNFGCRRWLARLSLRNALCRYETTFGDEIYLALNEHLIVQTEEIRDYIMTETRNEQSIGVKQANFGRIECVF